MNRSAKQSAKYSLGLLFFLTIFWLGWSGYFKPMLLSLGAASILGTIILSRKMGLDDEEGMPVGKIIGILFYLPFLFTEIAKANLDVAKRILQKHPDIQPQMVTIEASQETDTTRVLLANSITLTPGTVSVDIDGRRIKVHALSDDAAEDVMSGRLNDRVSRVEKS